MPSRGHCSRAALNAPARLFGDVEVAQQADQRREHAPGMRQINLIHRSCSGSVVVKAIDQTISARSMQAGL
jgi:hypothetical protein